MVCSDRSQDDGRVPARRAPDAVQCPHLQQHGAQRPLDGEGDARGGT